MDSSEADDKNDNSMILDNHSLLISNQLDLSFSLLHGALIRFLLIHGGEVIRLKMDHPKLACYLDSSNQFYMLNVYSGQCT